MIRRRCSKIKPPSIRNEHDVPPAYTPGRFLDVDAKIINESTLAAVDSECVQLRFRRPDQNFVIGS